MSEERFEDLFNEEKTQTPRLRTGDQIEARVADIIGENIFLDIGGKSEGVVDAAELTDEEGNLTVAPGDTLRVFYLATRGGSLVFTTRVGAGRASRQELEEAYRSGIPVEGRVTGEIKGGFEVMVSGQRGFCPYSQMDVRRIEDPAEYLDRQLRFRIVEYGERGRNLVLSARAVLEEEREEQRRQLRDSLEIGSRVRGTVTSLRDFGAFVDLGGVDGLIPVSELAWGEVGRVDDVLQRGQEVEVIVTSLDWERERIGLSLKATLENPWDRVAEKYPVGSVHTGRVSRLAAFGAFVTLEPGIDGLVHISKLGAGRRIHHPREAVEQGSDITVRVEAVDREKQRISLAPDDLAAPAAGENEEKEEQELRRPAKEKQSLGTLGDLLAGAMREKK
ncbi:MAG: 30S ribosomal protein S1 [Desulfobulbaceae bacterium]